MLVASAVVAIVLIVGLRNDQTRINDHDVPYTDAVAQAALDAKGIANDQRGYLLTGDRAFITEADQRARQARRAFDNAGAAAISPDQRAALSTARSGFERWLTAVQAEFATFQAGERQQAILASLGPDRETRKGYEQSLADAEALGDRSIESASNSIATASRRSVWILIAVLAVALSLGAAVARWLVRSVALPVFRLASLLMPD